MAIEESRQRVHMNENPVKVAILLRCAELLELGPLIRVCCLMVPFVDIIPIRSRKWLRVRQQLPNSTWFCLPSELQTKPAHYRTRGACFLVALCDSQAKLGTLATLKSGLRGFVVHRKVRRLIEKWGYKTAAAQCDVLLLLVVLYGFLLVGLRGISS